MTPSDYPDESSAGPGGLAVATATRPAWGPNFGQADDFATQDTTAPERDIPDPPDFARVIPVSAIQDAKNQQQADDWAAQQRADLADQWGTIARQQLQEQVADWNNQPQPQPEPTPTPEAAPAEPASQGHPILDQFFQGLGDLVDRLKSVNPQSVAQAAEPYVQGVPGVGPLVSAEANQDVIGQAVNKQNQVYDAATAAPQDDGTYKGMSGQTYAADEVQQARHNVETTAAGAAGGDVEGAGQAAAGIAREALDAAHPLVQRAADMLQQAGYKTVTAEKIANALQDAKTFAKITGSKNPERDLSQVNQAARQVWQIAQRTTPEAAEDLSGPLAQSVENAQANPAGAGRAPAPEAAPEAPVAAPAPEAAPGTPPTGETAEDIWNSVRGPGGGNEPAPTAPETPAATGLSLENLAKPGQETAPQTSKVWQAVDNLQDIAKQTVLAGSVFHPAVESAQLLRTGVSAGKPLDAVKAVVDANHAFLSSDFAKQFAADNADTIARAQKAGATMLDIGGQNPDLMKNISAGNRIARALFGGTGGFVGGYASAKAQGETDQEALQRGALFGLTGAGMASIAPTINARLWGNFVPVAKLQAFKMLEPLYGADVATKRVNDTFGGQNLEKLARDPGTQQVLRRLLLAPDWLESWARNAGATFDSGAEGQAARRYWAATAAGAVLTVEGLNEAINQRPTWVGPDGKVDMGHALRVDISKLVGQAPGSVYADTGFLGPIGSAANALLHGHPEEVLTSHLNVLPSTAYGALTNDAFPAATGQIVKPGTPAAQAALPEAAAAAGHVAPISVSTLGKKIPISAALASLATGVNIGPGTKASEQAGSPQARSAPRTPPRGGNLSKLSSFLAPAAKTTGRTTARSGLRSLSRLGG